MSRARLDEQRMNSRPPGQPADGAGASHRFPKHVRLIAYAYLMSVPFEIDLVLAGRSVSFWAAWILIVAVALQAPVLSRQTVINSNHRIVVPVLTLVGYAGLSYFWSVAPHVTASAGAVLLSTTLTWFALALVIADCLGQALTAFVAGTALMSVMLLAADVNIDGRADIAANVNDVAVVVALSCALLLARMTRPKLPLSIRVVVFALLLLHAAALLATGSRSGVLALIVAIAVFVLQRLVRLHLGSVVALVGVGGLIAAGIATLDITVSERIAQIPTALGTSDLNFREVIWDVAFQELPSVVGIGYGATPTFMQDALGIPTVMHSVYLGIALELGVVGLLIWGWLLIRLLIEARRTPWNRELVTMGVVAMVMAATLTLEARRPLWTYLALVASVAIVKVRGHDKLEEAI